MIKNNALTHPGSAIDMRKVFIFLLLFEIATMMVVLYGDLVVMAYYAAIVLTPLLLLLVPIEPTVGIVLMIAATGLDFLGAIVESGGDLKVNFTWFHIALLVTFVSTFLNMILRRQITIHSTSLWPPFIAFITVLAISLIYTPAFVLGFITFVRVVVMGFVALIVIESVNKKWRVGFIAGGIILVTVAISIITIYQLMTQGSFYGAQISKIATDMGIALYRTTGTFRNPNILACFLMTGIVVPFGLMFTKKLNPWMRTALMLSILINSIGIMSTFSRGGWISTFFALLMIVVLNKRWSFLWVAVLIVASGLVYVSITIPEFWSGIISRFTLIFDPTEASSSSRLALIRSGIWMWQDNPIFGVGIKGFQELYYDYVDPMMPAIMLYVHDPHTIQAEILAEEGLVGITVATWLFFTVLFHGLRTIKTMSDNFLKNAQITFTSLMVGFIVNFTFATDMTNNTFWMTVGMMYAIPMIDNHLIRNRAPESVTG